LGLLPRGQRGAVQLRMASFYTEEESDFILDVVGNVKLKIWQLLNIFCRLNHDRSIESSSLEISTFLSENDNLFF